MCHNHLIYCRWGERRGSNPRQPESQSGTLPTELRSPQYGDFTNLRLVRLILERKIKHQPKHPPIIECLANMSIKRMLANACHATFVISETMPLIPHARFVGTYPLPLL